MGHCMTIDDQCLNSVTNLHSSRNGIKLVCFERVRPAYRTIVGCWSQKFNYSLINYYLTIFIKSFVTGSRVCQAEFVASADREKAFEIGVIFAPRAYKLFSRREILFFAEGRIKNLAAAAAFDNNWGLT